MLGIERYIDARNQSTQKVFSYVLIKKLSRVTYLFIKIRPASLIDPKPIIRYLRYILNKYFYEILTYISEIFLRNDTASIKAY